ncbi:4-diphosphocytidyl-2-C-methyl-D-erythritol kinase [Bacteroidales bacterium Barb6]|nr:4-diphosphocytidyl-2-C-methyl-D-erythritol kinase [Bacteroidales bacterium Barb6]
MICFPNAKINLGLNVVSRRLDGYHNIETVFYPIPIKDALEVIVADKESFTQTGIPIGGAPEKNLVMKALTLLRERCVVPPLDIYLRKAVPFGAGLGGGSSDAAFMLRLVNEVFRLGLSLDELEETAQSVGADCPFFIRNTPVFASGTGNVFTPVTLSLKGYHLCLVKPDVTVSTPEAYAMITPAEPAVSPKDSIAMPVRDWKGRLTNDFEPPVFDRHPVIGAIKERLYKEGAVYASMSGSGSSVFGLFEEPAGLKELFAPHFVWEGELP